jgi:hypothetical protein
MATHPHLTLVADGDAPISDLSADQVRAELARFERARRVTAATWRDAFRAPDGSIRATPGYYRTGALYALARVA